MTEEKSSPSFLLLISLCRFSRSLSSSDLLSSVAKGLPAAAHLQGGPGTRGRWRHTLLSASPFVRKEKQRSNRLIIKFLKEAYATALPSPLSSVLIPSLWVLLIKFLYPRSWGRSPHSSFPVIVTFCPSAFMWSETCSQLLINSILLRSLPSLFQSLLLPLAFPWSYSFFIHLSVCLSCPFLKESLPLYFLPQPALKKCKSHEDEQIRVEGMPSSVLVMKTVEWRGWILVFVPKISIHGAVHK